MARATGTHRGKIISQIHKHAKGIKRLLRLIPFFKCPSYVPNKISKVPHHRNVSTHNNKNSNATKQLTTEEAMLGPFSYDHPESLEGKEI